MVYGYGLSVGCEFIGVLSSGLEYVGGVPYDILKPVLERCTSKQLYSLEEDNPVSSNQYKYNNTVFLYSTMFILHYIHLICYRTLYNVLYCTYFLIKIINNRNQMLVSAGVKRLQNSAVA